MKGKFSLNRLLHNNRLMILFSLIAAIAIWVFVVYGASNNETRTIPGIPVNLDLSNTYYGTNDLKIFSTTSYSVDVDVRGTRWVINQLKSDDDIIINKDYSGIQGVGEWEVRLTAQKNTMETDFSIAGWTPDKVKVFCDYSMKSTVMVQTDISGVNVSKDSDVQLGTPIAVIPGMENNMVTIEGPKSEVSRIESVVAKVDKPETISKLTTFSAKLEALDGNGQPVEMKYSHFVGLAEDKIQVTVPVRVERVVDFKYKLKNLPQHFRYDDNFCTVSPASIKINGTPEQVQSFADSIEDLGTFDFNHISLNDAKKVIPLNVPQGLRVQDGTSEVTVSFDMQGLSSTTLDLPLTASNTKVVSLPIERTADVTPQTISGINLIGSAESIAKISASNLSAIVDMGNTDTTGSIERKATIKVSGYNDVWVYYGKVEDGYPISITIR